MAPFPTMIDSRIKALVGDLAAQKRAVEKPTVKEIEAYLKTCFPGAEQFAYAFYAAGEREHWQDKKGRQIRNWKLFARRYASQAFINGR